MKYVPGITVIILIFLFIVFFIWAMCDRDIGEACPVVGEVDVKNIELSSRLATEIDEFIVERFEYEKYDGYVNSETFVRGKATPGTHYTPFKSGREHYKKVDDFEFELALITYRELEVQFEIETWEGETVEGYAIVPLASGDGLEFSLDCYPTAPGWLVSARREDVKRYTFIEGGEKWVDEFMGQFVGN